MPIISYGLSNHYLLNKKTKYARLKKSYTSTLIDFYTYSALVFHALKPLPNEQEN